MLPGMMKKKAAKNTETVTDLNIPKELVGDARMLIPLSQCPWVPSYTLGEENHFYIGSLIAAKSLWAIPNMGSKKIGKIDNMLASLKLKRKMIDEETSKVLLSQIKQACKSDLLPTKRKEAEAVIRKAFQISPDAVIPSYKEVSAEMVDFKLSLSPLFAAVIQRDDELKEKAQARLEAIATNLITKELQRVIEGKPADNKTHEAESPEDRVSLTFAMPLSSIYSIAVAETPALQKEITGEFKQAVLELVKESLKRQLAEIAPPAQG